MQRLSGSFPYQPYDYMDILKKERVVTGVFVMVNLWEFGLVSVIYRDNLSTWYCYEFEVQEMFNQALELIKDYDRLIRFKPLYAQLGDFFKKTRIDPRSTDLHGWFNPNSLTPDRSQNFYRNVQDLENGTTFVEMMRRLNRQAVGDTLAAS